MNTATAPHQALQNASFVIAFTGEGAACYVVQGGWQAMLERLALETIGSEAEKLAEPTHPNAEEWALWLDSLNDLDEWGTDEGSLPYFYTSEVGEISHVAIYRLSTDGVADTAGPLSLKRLCNLLVEYQVVDSSAVDDAEGYDAGVTMGRIEALHRTLTAGVSPPGHQTNCRKDADGSRDG